MFLLRVHIYGSPVTAESGSGTLMLRAAWCEALVSSMWRACKVKVLLAHSCSQHVSGEFSPSTDVVQRLGVPINGLCPVLKGMELAATRSTTLRGGQRTC